jgi:hypothetical protein
MLEEEAEIWMTAALRCEQGTMHKDVCKTDDGGVADIFRGVVDQAEQRIQDSVLNKRRQSRTGRLQCKVIECQSKVFGNQRGRQLVETDQKDHKFVAVVRPRVWLVGKERPVDDEADEANCGEWGSTAQEGEKHPEVL